MREYIAQEKERRDDEKRAEEAKIDISSFESDKERESERARNDDCQRKQ